MGREVKERLKFRMEADKWVVAKIKSLLSAGKWVVVKLQGDYSASQSSSGGSLVGLWNGWGYGIAFFRSLKFQISEPEIGENRSFFNSGIFQEISASEK